MNDLKLTIISGRLHLQLRLVRLASVAGAPPHILASGYRGAADARLGRHAREPLSDCNHGLLCALVGASAARARSRDGSLDGQPAADIPC